MTDVEDRTDSQLLNAFAEERDEAAFAELVRRHGPMVWSVCYRVLGRSTDVEDAAQAAFLALAKQAPRWRTSRPAAPWLHRVAYNIALNVLRSQKTRERREKEAAAMNQNMGEGTGLSGEQKALLHEEMNALPEKYRQALILFHLEGKSLQQTAEIMTCPTSTVGNWLARGREQLRDRLARRGLILSLAVLTALLSAEVGAAELPATFVTATTAAAALFVAKGAGAEAGLGSQMSRIAPLAEGELRKMSYAKLPVVVGALVLLLVVGSGIGWAYKGKGVQESTPVTQENKSDVFTDAVERNYPASFEELLNKLESAEPGKLPLEKAGTLDVTLSAGREGDSYRVTLDTSNQVISLSIPEDTEFDFNEKGPTKRSAPLAASVAAAMGRSKFRSASMLAFKAKQFDDGLYAAVEYAVNQGTDRFTSRPSLLADLAELLKAAPRSADTDQALGLLGAASKLGGSRIEIHEIAATHATVIEQEFLANPLRSKPIGFYTWSQELRGIFQRDRLLQTVLEPGTSRAFARALGSDAELFKQYQAALRLPARLTNGFARESLAEAAHDLTQETPPELKDLALFPPSRAYETDLIKKLYGDKPIPDGFDLADELVRRIQSGTLSLAPGKDSGWYDHQTFALEPLIVPDKMPEAKHLSLHSSYKNELIKLFKALLALTRETHIKQLELPECGAAMLPPGIILHLYPQLSQEPLATFYLRRALAYRFVRSVLLESFGETGLAGMKRLTAAGPVNLTLDRELRAMESLFYGAYLNTAHELGMTPEAPQDLGLGAPKSLALYQGWEPNEDPDVSCDMRCMVPVFYDIERKQTKVWVVLGVATRPLSVSYRTCPGLQTVVDVKSGKPVDLAKVDLQFEDAQFTVAYPVMAEVYVTKILDRKEFRDLCDQHKTQEAILSQLK